MKLVYECLILGDLCNGDGSPVRVAVYYDEDDGLAYQVDDINLRYRTASPLEAFSEWRDVPFELQERLDKA